MAQFKCIKCSSTFDDDISGIVYCPYCSEIQPLPIILTEEQKEAVYEQAVAMSYNAKSLSNIKDAIYILEQLDGYKEVSHHLERCKARVKDFENDAIYADALQKMELESINGYREAIELFSKIPDWKNSSFKLDEAKVKLEALLEKRQERIDKASKITMLASACLIFVGILVFVIVEFLTPAIRYSSALNMIENGNYDKAYAILEDLGDYKDAPTELKKSKYNRAQEYLQAGDILSACKYFGEAKGYNDADKQATELCKKLTIEEQLSVLGVGNTVIFGFYEQDGDPETIPASNERMEWIIADKSGDEVLLISKYAIETASFSEEPSKWSKSELRRWLNEDFYLRYFFTNEREIIISKRNTTIQKTESSEESTDTSNDYLFLLSENEAKKYFASDDERSVLATEYVKSTGVYVNPDNSTVYYWLRTLSPNGEVMYVNGAGAINEAGRESNAELCVRPAVWVKAK